VSVLRSYPDSVKALHENMQGLANDGQPARLITLCNGSGMTATFMDLGATWLSCTLPMAEGAREVLLGVDTLAAFYQQAGYLGVTVGRFANRINNAQFSLHGKDYSISKNQGAHCLHGGVEGFNRRRWTLVEWSDRYVVYGLRSPDGDQGFPGQLDVTVCYELTQTNGISISYHGVCDQDCPVSLTNHAYFNLQGDTTEMDCRDHELLIDADSYLPIDASGVPISGCVPVAKSGFDFRLKKPIRQDFLKDEQQQLVGGYDHAYLLNQPSHRVNLVSSVNAPDQAVRMDVSTSMPSAQLYTGNFLDGCPRRGGGYYKNHAGFAFETQYLPDSPNHPEWTFSNSLLKANKAYHHKTLYEFVWHGLSAQ